MPVATVIIHGWSDQSASFVALKSFLAANGYPADSIYYGDWLSREDNISYGDVATALNQEFFNRGFIDATGRGLVDLNVIVHSTGGLIIRQWLVEYYFPDDTAESLGSELQRCPVKNIVMLAPANFGSPLAEMGKSWVGGIIKGTHHVGLDFFATGRTILNGLELGSSYQWKLAHQDLMRAHPYFTSSGIQVTVFVGTQGYGGIEGFFADKAGSDGTVLISGANLNSVKFALVPPPAFAEDQTRSTWQYLQPPLEVAYQTLAGLNHHTVTLPENSGASIIDALVAGASTNRAGDFLAMRTRCVQATDAVYAAPGAPTAYQQFLFHICDDTRTDISDFTVEFLLVRRSGFDALVAGTRSLDDLETHRSLDFQKTMTSDVNTFSQNASYRSFLVDVNAAVANVAAAGTQFAEEPVPALRFYVPEVDDHIYYDLRSLHIVAADAGSAGTIHGQLALADAPKPTFVHPNTTTLVDVTVRRSARNSVWVALNPTPHP